MKAWSLGSGGSYIKSLKSINRGQARIGRHAICPLVHLSTSSTGVIEPWMLTEKTVLTISLSSRTRLAKSNRCAAIPLAETYAGNARSRKHVLERVKQ